MRQPPRQLDPHAVLAQGSSDYPAGLRRLARPPTQLFLWGFAPQRLSQHLSRAVAIVGTRAAREESVRLAEQMAAELARAGVCIVSGGAIGIDGAAHEGALAAGGVTVAVLGSGLERLYPARHLDLFSRISRAGAVLTPFAPETPPRRGNFFARNRLIAALVQAVVVIEAPARSGALNTALHGRQLGVPVLAVPAGAGALALLRSGAGAVGSGNDVLAVLGGQAPAPFPKPPADADELDVLELLRAAPMPAGLSIDEVAALLGWRLPRAAIALVRLELGGWIAAGAGGSYGMAAR